MTRPGGRTDNETSTPTDKPVAGPSKRLQEFMDVMKGSDPSKPTEEGAANAGVKGPRGSEKNASVKGKQKAEEAEPEDAEADDDAAWLERRRKAALGGEEDGEPGVKSVCLPIIVRHWVRPHHR